MDDASTSSVGDQCPNTYEISVILMQQGSPPLRQPGIDVGCLDDDDGVEERTRPNSDTADGIF